MKIQFFNSDRKFAFVSHFEPSIGCQMKVNIVHTPETAVHFADPTFYKSRYCFFLHYTDEKTKAISCCSHVLCCYNIVLFRTLSIWLVISTVDCPILCKLLCAVFASFPLQVRYVFPYIFFHFIPFFGINFSHLHHSAAFALVATSHGSAPISHVIKPSEINQYIPINDGVRLLSKRLGKRSIFS